MISQYPPTSTAENPEKAQRLAHGVLTACFILFVIFCNFSISITQAAAYTGVVVWLIQTYRQKAKSNLKFPLAWPLVSFVLAAGIATLTAVDVGLSLSRFKKLFKIVIFFWVVNALATTRPWELLVDLAGWFRLSKLKKYL